jgi:hypothetical protein
MYSSDVSVGTNGDPDGAEKAVRAGFVNVNIVLSRLALGELLTVTFVMIFSN